MQPPDDNLPDHTWGFTRTHRIGIAMLASIFLVLLAVRYYRHPTRLDDPVVIADGKPLQLDPRVDPNTAEAVSLARLPQVTPAMSQAIVQYRKDQALASGDPVVFRSLADVARVKVGTRPIPKSTLEALRPYLKLVDETPAPSSGNLIPPKLLPPDFQPTEPDPD